MSARTFWREVWQQVARLGEPWPGGDMSREDRAEEFARISREFAEEQAKRKHRPPPWAQELTERLDRIEKRLDEMTPTAQPIEWRTNGR